jgi:hypothetical protein
VLALQGVIGLLARVLEIADGLVGFPFRLQAVIAGSFARGRMFLPPGDARESHFMVFEAANQINRAPDAWKP